MSAAASPPVSVVIPTFNRRSYLSWVLRPLLADPEALEIIVVVDGCHDGSAELLQELAKDDPRLRPVVTENQGMSQARMAGAQLATGDVVLLLDDDVRAAPGLVGGHARAHARGERLVVVGAMPVAGGPQANARDYPRAMYATEYLRHCRRWLDRPETVLSTLWAGHLSLRRDDLLALDPVPLPELGRGYHSDIDFGLRCRRAGLRGVYDASLRAEHFYDRNPEQFLRDARNSGRSLLLLRQAHPEEGTRYSEEMLLAALPVPLRPLVRGAVNRGWIVRAVELAIVALGRLRLFRLQRGAAFTRWLMEQVREIATPSPPANAPLLPQEL